MLGSRSSDAFSSFRHISFHTWLESAHANRGNGQDRKSDDGVTQHERAGTWDDDLLVLLVLFSLLRRWLLCCEEDFLLACGVVSPLVCQLPWDASHDGLRMMLLAEAGLTNG